MSSSDVSVTIVYPADPVGVIPGGIDTFIKGIISSAPDNLNFSLIGITTDEQNRPTGRWTRCKLGEKAFNFFPLFYLKNPHKQSRIPLSLRFSFRLLFHKQQIKTDVVEFHRIEPSLIFLFDPTPKNIFVHQDMAVLKEASADIRWKYFPTLFYKLQDWLLPKFQSVFVVRESAVENYRARFLSIANRFRFVPTWMDPEIFYQPNPATRNQLRAEISNKYMLSDNDLLLVTAGRLDTQKDPLLLLESFQLAITQHPNIRLIYIGDGVLRPELENIIEEEGLEKKVVLAGLQPATEVARILQASDLFCLSSAYEGMPMCVLEALGCGVPVMTTDVGEVRRVVKPGINGEISTTRDASELAKAIGTCLKKLDSYKGKPCLEAVSEYTPVKVLAPVYENYRKLAGMNAR